MKVISFCLPPLHQLYLYSKVKEKTLFVEYRQSQEFRGKNVQISKFIIIVFKEKHNIAFIFLQLPLSNNKRTVLQTKWIFSITVLCP